MSPQAFDFNCSAGAEGLSSCHVNSPTPAPPRPAPTCHPRAREEKGTSEPFPQPELTDINCFQLAALMDVL